MQPTTMPTIVKLRNAVIRQTSRLDEQVVAVAAEGLGRVVHPHELAALDLEEDVAGGWALPRRVGGRIEPVAVELMDVLQGGDERRALGPGPGRLQGLHEHAGRLPAGHAEEVH